MQTLNMSQFSKSLHPEKDKRPQMDKIIDNLSKSSFGKSKPVPAVPPSLDSFQLTEQLSELLSPACGMTEDEKQKYMSQIMAKLKSGKALTAEEMRFLQATDPQLYLQVARVQSLRESLKTQLEHCNSKQDAKELYSYAMTSIGDDSMQESIAAAYQEVMKDFQESCAAKSLPDEFSMDPDTKKSEKRMEDKEDPAK